MNPHVRAQFSKVPESDSAVLCTVTGRTAIPWSGGTIALIAFGDVREGGTGP